MAVARATSDRAPAAPLGLPPHLVLFDGVCVFCEGAVRWIMERDPDARFHFAPLQGETAAALRRAHPQLPESIDTLVYVESRDRAETIHLRSAAAFRILSQIRGPWRGLAWLRVLPRFLTDRAYDAFVRVRYRLFGKRDVCLVPNPEERDRFLD